MELETIAISDLVDNLAQPGGRSNASVMKLAAMQELIREIQEEKGLWGPPIVTRSSMGGYVVIDGHRRIAAWKSLGHKMVQVIILPGERTAGECAKLFARRATTTKKLRGRDAAEGYANLPTSDDRKIYADGLSSNISSKLRALRQILGSGVFDTYAKSARGLNPSVLQNARTVEGFLRVKNALGELTLKDIIVWACEVPGLHDAKALARLNKKSDALKIAKAIESGKPFRISAAEL